MRKTRIATCLLTLAVCANLHAAQQAAHPNKPTIGLPGTADQPVATIETSMGNLTCQLFPKAAPEGTANFIGLARGTKDWTDPRTGKKMHGVPLYDNTIFHRVIPEYMIQGGDPEGDGWGSPGYQFKNETWPDLHFDQPGRLAYANGGPDTNGSQFFITEVPTPFLDGRFTIFGQCDAASVELVKKIARQPRNGKDRPDNPVVIKHIRISEGAKAKPAAKQKGS
jgi:peptidyl-prolyl cis-trans isomerase A (cyclophilin A)